MELYTSHLFLVKNKLSKRKNMKRNFISWILCAYAVKLCDSPLFFPRVISSRYSVGNFAKSRTMANKRAIGGKHARSRLTYKKEAIKRGKWVESIPNRLLRGWMVRRWIERTKWITKGKERKSEAKAKSGMSETSARGRKRKYKGLVFINP